MVAPDAAHASCIYWSGIVKSGTLKGFSWLKSNDNWIIAKGPSQNSYQVYVEGGKTYYFDPGTTFRCG